jgi:hypothetical protein
MYLFYGSLYLIGVRGTYYYIAFQIGNLVAIGALLAPLAKNLTLLVFLAVCLVRPCWSFSASFWAVCLVIATCQVLHGTPA